MKLIAIFLVTMAGVLSTTNSPMLLSVSIARDGRQIFNEPAIEVDGGGHTVIHVGKTDFLMSPALAENGPFIVKVVVKQRDGDIERIITKPTLFSTLGGEVKLEVGDLIVFVKVSPPK